MKGTNRPKVSNYYARMNMLWVSLGRDFSSQSDLFAFRPIRRLETKLKAKYAGIKRIYTMQ